MQKEGVYAHGHACVKFEDGTVKVLLVEGVKEDKEVDVEADGATL